MMDAKINIDSLAEIDPSQISTYLSSHGWTQLQAVEDAIIWQISANGRTSRILLPLNKNIPDFCYRLYDLIRAVSSVEKRSESEVLSSVQTSLEVSKYHQEKVVIRISLKTGINSEDTIPAKRLGPLLVRFQSLIDALAQFEEGRSTESGLIPSYITDTTQFSVTSTFKGSFGITLVNDSLEEATQKNVLKEPLPQRSLKRFMSLLKASKNENNLKENLTEIKKRAASSYRNFLLALSDAQTDNVFEWGSYETNDLERVELSFSEVAYAFEVTNKTVVEAPDDFEIKEAEWIGGNKRRQDFEVKDLENDETYTGSIAAEAMGQAEMARWRGIYTVLLRREVEIVQATEQRRIKHTLLSIRPFNQNKKSNRSESETEKSSNTEQLLIESIDEPENS